MMKRWMLLALALVLALSPVPGWAEPGGAEPAVRAIRLNRSAAKLFAGTQITLSAAVSPSGAKVTWTSGNEAVAAVDEKGAVTGRAPGSAWITAAAGSGAGQKSARCMVTVKAAPVQSFRLDHQEIALGVGETFQLSGASFLPAYAYNKSLAWSSQNPTTASVDPATGLVRGVNPAKTRIVARSHNGKTAVCVVKVTGDPRALAVKLNVTAKVLAANRSFQLKATVVPASSPAEDHAISWESSDPRIATVDEQGRVTAGGKSGRCKITATSGNGRVAACQITVKAIAAQSISLPMQRSMEVGEVAMLPYSLKPANASSAVAWTSSDPTVATVEAADAAGKVTALSKGTTTITATAGAAKATCLVRVGMGKEGRLVTITATGDITIGGDPRPHQVAPATERYYDGLYAKYKGDFLGELKGAFNADHEVTLVNLESNLSTATRYASKSYVFRGKPAYADILLRAGVDVVGHANNHSMDLGAVGARDTRSAVTAHNMRYASGGTQAIVDVNGVRVGLLAFNALNARSLPTSAKNMIAQLNKTCGLVVVSFHWGKEWVYGASPAQRNIGRAAVLAGADLVVGHHSHVVSGVEKYKGKYIAYGLGTLSSAILTPNDMDNIVFQQTFRVGSDPGQVEEESVKLIACSTSSNPKVNDARTQRLSGTARAGVLGKVKKYSAPFSQTLPDSAFE
ncbi:Ig-like domain-containing protein [Bacillota bacterium Meth-B3]